MVPWSNPRKSGQMETRGDRQPLQCDIQVQKNGPKSKIEPIFRYSDPTLCEAALNAAENKIFEFIFQFPIDLCTQILITLPQEGVILDYLDSRYVRDFLKILKKSSDNLDLSRWKPKDTWSLLKKIGGIWFDTIYPRFFSFSFFRFWDRDFSKNENLKIWILTVLALSDQFFE